MRTFLTIFLMLTAFLSLGAVNEQDKAKLTGESQLLKNPGFEASKSDWSASGGTFSIDLASPLFGAASATWDSDALAQTLDSVLYPITTGFLGKSCQVELEYTYAAGSDGDYKLVVRQFDFSGASEADVLEVPLNVTSDSRKAQQFFDCPDDVQDTLRFRIESTVADAGLLEIDKAFLGTGRNSFQLSQTELVAYAHYPQTLNCNWITTAGSYGFFPNDPDCGSIVVDSSTQTVNTANNQQPDIVFDNLYPGKYLVTAIFNSTNDGSGNSCGYVITDGVTNGQEAGTSFNTISSQASRVVATHLFDKTTAGPQSFTLLGVATAGGCYVANGFAGRDLVWTVEKFPTSSAEAITLETTGFVVEGLLTTASVDPTIGLVDQLSYQPITDSTITLTQTQGPSGAAEVACDGAVSTGITCSGTDEQIGVTIDFPKTGKYMGCFYWQHQSRTLANGSFVDQIFKVAMTSDGSDVIEQDGTVHHRHFNEGEASASQAQSIPFASCNIFDVNSLRKSFKLFGYLDVGGSIDQNLMVMRGNAAEQRGVSFKFFPLNQQFPTPVFTDLQNSLDAKVGTAGNTSDEYIMSSAIIGMGGSNPNIIFENGNWIDSLVDNGIGNTTINIVPGVFAFLNCVCTSRSANRTCINSSTGNSAAVTEVNLITSLGSTGATSDVDFHIICYGKKQ